MQKIKIVCVGRMKEKYWVSAFQEYAKRLQRYCSLEVIEIADVSVPDRPSNAQIEEVLKKEGELLLKRLSGERNIVALCVEGQQMDSETFSDRIKAGALQGETVCFVIGGSYGLWKPVKERAVCRLSFSKMTLPHQLMRVVLAEQIYRGFKIISGEQYHK